MGERQLFKCTQEKLLKSSQGERILDYIRAFNNEIIIFDRSIHFNGHIKGNLNGAQTYESKKTADGESVVVFCRNPHCIQILNLKGQGFWTLLQQESFDRTRIVDVSLKGKQRSPNGKEGHPKLYLILEDYNCFKARIIQFQSDFQQNPKEKIDSLQQTINAKNEFLFPEIFLSRASPNIFLAAPNGQLKVYMITFKQGKLKYDYSTQKQDSGLREVFMDRKVMKMIEGNETWAIVCQGATQSQLSIHVTHQHKQGQRSQRMYASQDLYIKTTKIPCACSEFLKIVYVPCFYLIETKSNVSHQCWIIQEKEKDPEPIVCFDLTNSPNSRLCLSSLKSTSNSLRICEILHDNEIIQSIMSENTSPQTPLNNEKKNETKSEQANIRNFEAVQEKDLNQQKIKIEDVEEKQKQKPEEMKSLISPLLINNFDKVPTIEQKQNESQSGDQIDLPNKLESNISFGAPAMTSQIKKVQKKNDGLISFGSSNSAPKTIKQETKTENKNVLISFGAKQKIKIDQKVEKPIEAEKKQEPLIKEEKKQIKMEENKQIFFSKQKLISIMKPIFDNYMTEFTDSENSLGKYPTVSDIKGIKLSIDPILTQADMARIERSWQNISSNIFHLEQCQKDFQRTYQKLLKLDEELSQIISSSKFWFNFLDVPMVNNSLFKILKKSRKRQTSLEQMCFQRLGFLNLRVCQTQIKVKENFRRKIEEKRLRTLEVEVDNEKPVFKQRTKNQKHTTHKKNNQQLPEKKQKGIIIPQLVIDFYDVQKMESMIKF